MAEAFYKLLTAVLSTTFIRLPQGNIDGMYSASSQLFEKFLKGDEQTAKLYIVYNESNNSLTCHTNFETTSLHNSKLFYILRKVKGALPLKEPQLSESLGYGLMSNLLLDSIEPILAKVYVPMLQKVEEWGKVPTDVKKEFIGATSKFVENLSEVVAAAQIPSVKLQTPSPNFIIPNNPKAFNDNKNNEGLNNNYESIVLDWIRDIDRMLAEKQTKNDDIGPKSELEYWKGRMTKVNNVMEQLRKDEMKAVVGFLQAVKSPIVKEDWKALDARITDAQNEAKDNVKYLLSLEKYFEALYQEKPTQIIEILPGLMKNLKMVYGISRYYSSNEKMSGLLLKITNQMINNCKETLITKGGRLWDEEVPTLLKSLKECKRLNEEYQKSFRLERDKSLKQSGTKPFDFNELSIFGKFDLFCSRIEQLIDLFSTVEQFTTLKNSGIDGMESLVDKFFASVEDMKRKSTDLLDYTKNSFDKDYMVFCRNVENIEQSLQVFMNTSFENISNSQQALDLLEKFQTILQRETLKAELENKYSVIFHNYGLQLEAVQKTYEKYKNKPRLIRNAPPVAGNIIWCRQLMRRIEEPIAKFQTSPALKKSKETKKVIKSFNVVIKALFKFEQMWIEEWTRCVESAKAGLEATLLVKKNSKYYVNFDKEIFELIRETKWLMKMGIEVPENAKMVIMQEQRFKSSYSLLSHTIREYERITANILPDIRPVVEAHYRNLEKIIEPGVTFLQWSSISVHVYVLELQQSVKKFEELIIKVTDTITGRIQKNIDFITETPLVYLPTGDSFSFDEFVELQEKHIKEQSEAMNVKSLEIEQAVNDLISTLTTYPLGFGLEVSKQSVISLKKHFEDSMLKALSSTTTRSLQSMRKRIASKPVAGVLKPEVPLFMINVELKNPNVIINPSMDDVTEAVNTATIAVLNCSKNLKPWTHNDNSKSESFYKKITKDIEILKVIVLLNGGLSNLKKQVSDYVSHFARYAFLWNDNREKTFKQFLEKYKNEPSIADYEAEIRKYVELEEEINGISETYIIGALSLSTGGLKTSMKQEASGWKLMYAKSLHESARILKDNMLSSFDDYNKRLSQDINSLNALKLGMDVIREIREKESTFESDFQNITDRYAILKKYNIDAPKEEFDDLFDIPMKWDKITAAANKLTEDISKLQAGFRKELVKSVKEFIVDVMQFRVEFEAQGPGNSNLNPDEAIERLKKYSRLYAERERKYDTYNAGEKLFAMTLSEYPQLQKTKKELEGFEKLYGLYQTVFKKIRSYEDVLWTDLDFQSITEEINSMQAQFNKLPKSLKSQYKAAELLRTTLEDFTKLIPLLEMLKEPAVRPYHWSDIEKLAGAEFKKDDEIFKLKDILEAHIERFQADVEDICFSAKKEAEIELKIVALEKDWKERELIFANHGHRGPIILKAQETMDLMEALEDSQMNVSSIISSRYVARFREKVSLWMAKLSQVSETVRQWQIVQGMWSYLEAVFSSGDIAAELPAEAKRFSGIDKTWVKIMQSANASPNVIEFCYGNEMLKALPYLKEQLEQCQKSLTGYLGKKRDLFPRFYFCSDPVLLEILSQASDPHKIQAQLSQIFDSVSAVVFDKKQENKILNILSVESENVALSQPVIAEGQVEEWLERLVKEMCKTMKNIIRESAEDCTSLPLQEFIKKYPAQVALLGIQFIWTLDCEEAFKSKERNKALAEAAKKVDAIFNDLTVITTNPNLTPLERTKIETMITIQVHQRDVFYELKKKGVKDSDFDWQKQARFYWRPDIDDCLICIADIDNLYCYEFLGCKERLVITPLTDRCYITLSQAIGLKLGGAPAGPAGTGKTETVKDLGRTLGKYVVVFNCSDQMDYRAMGKIFKGLAQSGAWGDFDEFNRIELEVLSVVAQQIQRILTAMREQKDKFVFTDGTLCTLDNQTAIFITMNPGYQGRQELPENLKVLFRGVAMMMPDREMIIRVKLAASGYSKKNIDTLAKKFNVLYRLCEQQLSKQPHYDFGLRNILSVLRTAGETKRSNPDKSESYLLMRTLRDMNNSKFVAEDVGLFMSLIGDLFPGIKADKRRFPELEAGVQKHVQEMRLMLHPSWFEKVIQLYETALVRHGIMVVGPSGVGKTTVYNVLLKTLSDVEAPRVFKEFRMNPKAITAMQMFGRLVGNDWINGIFSALWKTANSEQVAKKMNVWIICDGPVDAIWIENLNTVLDDNKLLTLADGTRLPMAPTVKLCFEVENLKNASPATVSRAGQIYMSESALGWKPIVDSKVLGVEKNKGEIVKPFKQHNVEFIKSLFSKFVDPVLEYVEKELKPMMLVPQMSQVVTCFNILQSLVEEHERKEGKFEEGKIETIDLDNDRIEKLFIFAFIWAFGGVLEAADQIKFSVYVQKMSKLAPPNTSKTVFDFFVDKKTGTWRKWVEIVPEWVYPANDNLDFSTLYVPTQDSVRIEYLMDKIVGNKRDILLIGGSGTAKTVTIENYLRSKFTSDTTMFKKINFSSATTPNIFQNSIQSVIEKRFRAFGPPGGKRMAVFVDDINMPEINVWGDQVTNELVRQLVEFKGVYNLDEPGEWIAIEDLQYVAAMSHPGGGKNDIPNRLKRQFSIFNVTLPSENSIDQIFGAIIRGRYNGSRTADGQILNVVEKMTSTTITLWKRVAEKMLPTPAKFHYIFNLRDLSRVYQGIMLCPFDIVQNSTILLNLWKHECIRVFADRLNDINDKKWFDEALEIIIRENFGPDYSEVTKEPAYFVNFLRDPVIDEETDEILEAAPKIYEPVASVQALRERLEKFMAEYNKMAEQKKIKKLDLVLFDAAVKHLVRISRILAMPRGNALLVGVGGSGKQSLTRLSSFIAGNQTKQIVLTKNYNQNNLFENLKEYYKIAGGQGIPVTFIFTDNEIKQETFLEFINNLLSSGEIPGLFQKDELDSIVNDLRAWAKKNLPDTLGRNDSYENLYKFFIDRVRDNLHVVLCFSPVGEKFRLRAQKFPGLISGCTIDWFFPWPEDALISVARKFLDNFQIECTSEVKDRLIKFMASVQMSMSHLSEQYFERFRRHVYTTPKSYLSFLELYREVYKNKFNEINSSASKINNGLKTLHKAGEDVEKMKIVLKDKEANLAIAQKKTEELLKEISVSTAKAEQKKNEVQTVKDALEIDFKIVDAEKTEAEKDLALAKPALEAAQKALSSIDPKDIQVIKNFKNPAVAIKQVCDAVLIIRNLDVNTVKFEQDKEGVNIVCDSYSNSLKMMSDVNFLPSLMKFDPKSLNAETIELLEPYLRWPGFEAGKIKKVSEAAAGLGSWAIAMRDFYFAYLKVKPRQENLEISKAKLEVATTKLRAQEAELAVVQAALDEIQRKFDEAQAKKQELQDDAVKTRKNMDQANNLIVALSGEKDRWTQQSNEFKDLINRLTGDVALACAFISYCGPFNSEFRNTILNDHYYKDCEARNIPVTKNLNIIKLLADEAQIGAWGLQGLPSDPHSIQNAIMITRSSKWPLLVDPQGQGLAWLKKKEEKDLRIARLTDKYFKQVLEDCMSNGWPLIIENIEEEVDPMLDPVLDKDIVMVGKTQKQIIIQDKGCDLHDKFRLYLITKLSNPHFSPELYAKTTVIDFTVTLGGLEQQLLAYVIQKEKAELEEQREKLMQEVNQNLNKINMLEDELLQKLLEAKGNLLENTELIGVLASTKKTASEVKEKLNVARETEARINLSREEYRPVAVRGSTIYFIIVELSLVNPMYQTSLKQFLFLFDKAIHQAEKAQLSSKRTENIIEKMTFSISTYISRGLFKRHKFLFILLLTCKILLRSKTLSHEAFSSLLKGGAALDINSVRKKPFEWLPDIAWLNIINLSNTIEIFKTLPDLISRNDKIWKKFYDEEKPELAKVPEIHDKLNTFQILLLIRSLREDRTILAAQEFIKESLGAKYIDPVPIVLEDTWAESNNAIPLVCLLSPGSDPTSMIETLAKKKKKEVPSISMGQGQEKAAEELIRSGFANGHWVLLQNCHLGLKFIQGIEDMINEAKLQDTIHPDFRIWITSEPNPRFPVGLLQMSIKLTLEGDVGIKAGMKSAFQWVTQDILDASKRLEWRSIVYAVCFLNTIVQERRKFGPLGFNIPYEFNNADLTASLAFLQNHFSSIGDDAKKGPPVSWETVKYMICEVHYGGKITDDFDRIMFTTLGNEWISPIVAKEDFEFFKGYKIPSGDDRQKYVDYIEQLPPVDAPEVFGLHGNADITYRSQQSNEVLSTILDIQPKESSSSGGETREKRVEDVANNLLSKLPSDWKRDDIRSNIKRLGGTEKFPLNIFLFQEIDRLQRLISVTRKTLLELKLAIDGTIILSEDLLDALNNLYDARVPSKWLSLSWESATLGLWFSELLARYDQLNNWLTKDRPKSFWLTGFYNPQGFLTSVQQEVTRKHSGWALDDVSLKTEVTKLELNDVVDAPAEGVYVHGLYLEGAGWDKANTKLCEAKPKVLYTPLPVLFVTATDAKENKKSYSCPCYRHKKRTGLNYIFNVDLNCTEKQSHWVLRGVALLTKVD